MATQSRGHATRTETPTREWGSHVAVYLRSSLA
jgi:hypothetical protein